MSWNLFEKIINAFRPRKESEQASEASDPSQSWPEGGSEQSWPEGSTEQPEDSQEPSPSYQETPGTPQQNEWQQK